MMSAYETLGVPSNANVTEIKAAYRKLVQTVHPDRHPNADEVTKKALADKFTVITDAYKQLRSAVADKQQYVPFQTSASPRTGFVPAAYKTVSTERGRVFDAFA